MIKIHSKDEFIFDLINYILLFFVLVIIMFPLIFIISASFSSPEAVNTGKVILLPREITIEGYQRIFRDSRIWQGYRNTILYTFVGTGINVVMTVLAAYPLSRKDFYGRKLFTFMITFTMFFSGGLLPTYILISNLNLINTFWVMVIPNAIAVWNVIITRTYFQHNIPDEMLEASKLDGCNNLKFLLKIVLPLSAPILAVITLYYAVNHWNQFFQALIYLNDEKRYPLQLILRSILVQNEMSMQMMDDIQSVVDQQRIAEVIRYGVVIVASVPVLCLYPFLQKYFVKGVMVGSLKG